MSLVGISKPIFWGFQEKAISLLVFYYFITIELFYFGVAISTHLHVIGQHFNCLYQPE